MAEKTWQQLWLDNYDCKTPETENLDTFVRTFTVGKKKGKPRTVSYLPWAAAERPFKLQGGKIELVKTNENTIVEVDEAVVGREVDPQTGTVTERIVRSYFVNVKATWLEQTYTERYPLMSVSNEPLYSWSQNDLNKAIQRAKTKAIAIVSGIGYKLFEQTDSQFEEDEKLSPEQIATFEKKLKNSTPTTQTTPPAPPVPPKSTSAPSKSQEKNVKETEIDKSEFFKMPSDSGKKPDSKTVKDPTPATSDTSTTKEKTDSELTLERVEMENEIKEAFLGAKQQDERSKLYDFLMSHKTTKISELSLNHLKELHKMMVK